MQLELLAESVHDTLELHLGIDLGRFARFDFVLRPVQHRLELPDLRQFEATTHDHLHHRLAQSDKVRLIKEHFGPRLDECEDHVDQFRGGRVTPVIILEGAQHHANDLDPEELLGVMEASLKKFRQIVVLRGAYQARYVGARQRTGSGVQVIQQNSESLWIELDDVELKIFMFINGGSNFNMLLIQSILYFSVNLENPFQSFPSVPRYVLIVDVSLTSVCANLALSTFCASAQTLSRGTANDWAALSLSFASLSVKDDV